LILLLKDSITKIHNPQIPIKPLEKSNEGINLEKALDHFTGMPDFGFVEDTLGISKY